MESDSIGGLFDSMTNKHAGVKVNLFLNQPGVDWLDKHAAERGITRSAMVRLTLSAGSKVIDAEAKAASGTIGL